MGGSSVTSSLEDKLLPEIRQSESSPCFSDWTFFIQRLIEFCSFKIGAHAESWFSYIPAWIIKHPSISSNFFFPLRGYLSLTWRPDLRSAMSEASFSWYLLTQQNTKTSLCVKGLNAMFGDCFKWPAIILTAIFAVHLPTGNALGKLCIIWYSLLKTQVSIPGYWERIPLENSTGGREGFVLSP